MEISPVRILLVEDHKLMRVGLKSLFEEHKELEVISEAQTGKEAVDNYKISHPDVVLMDIGLPDITGIEAAKKIISEMLPHGRHIFNLGHGIRPDAKIENVEALCGAVMEFK